MIPIYTSLECRTPSISSSHPLSSTHGESHDTNPPTPSPPFPMLPLSAHGPGLESKPSNEPSALGVLAQPCNIPPTARSPDPTMQLHDLAPLPQDLAPVTTAQQPKPAKQKQQAPSTPLKLNASAALTSTLISLGPAGRPFEDSSSDPLRSKRAEEIRCRLESDDSQTVSNKLTSLLP